MMFALMVRGILFLNTDFYNYAEYTNSLVVTSKNLQLFCNLLQNIDPFQSNFRHFLLYQISFSLFLLHYSSLLAAGFTRSLAFLYCFEYRVQIIVN